MDMSNRVGKLVRSCEFCGKEEFRELKSTDFFDEEPTIVIKNYKGEQIKFGLSLFTESHEEDPKQDKLMDIHENYMNPIHTMIINGPDGNEFLDELPQTTSSLTLCKVCYRGLVNTISRFGKFDKVEVF